MYESVPMGREKRILIQLNIELGITPDELRQTIAHQGDFVNKVGISSAFGLLKPGCRITIIKGREQEIKHRNKYWTLPHEQQIQYLADDITAPKIVCVTIQQSIFCLRHS